MGVLLAILYFLLFSLLIYRLPIFKLGRISKPQLLGLFAIKCVAGLVYVFANSQWLNGGDIFFYFRDGEIIYHYLYRDPITYLELTFGPNGGEIPTHLTEPIFSMGFWGYPSPYMVVRLHAIVNIFTFAHWEANTIFFSFASFTGLLALAKVFERELGANRLAVLSLFIYPSILFWSSGTHKEPLLFLGFGLFIWSASLIMRKERLKLAIPIHILGGLLLFVIRDFAVLLLLPALLGLLWTLRYKSCAWLKYSAVYALITLLAALIKIPSQGKNFLELIMSKREGFSSLGAGHTQIELPSYQADLWHFILNIPAGLVNTLFRPFIWESNSIFHILMALENIALTGLIVFAIIRHRISKQHLPYLWFFLFYGLSLLLAAGIIVPNLGAIARYRIMGLIFIVPIVFSLCFRSKSRNF